MFAEGPREIFVFRRIMFRRPSGKGMRDVSLSNSPYLPFTVNIARDMYGTAESICLNPGLATLSSTKWFIDIRDSLQDSKSTGCQYFMNPDRF